LHNELCDGLEDAVSSLMTGELAQRFMERLGVLERQGDEAVAQMVELFSPMARLTNAAMRRARRTIRK
jgi:hypothetical protein